MNQALTNTPTALAGVTAGTLYEIQNNSRHVVYIEEAAAAPSDPSGANRLHPSGSPLSVGRFRPTDSVWVWVTGLHPDGAVVYNEAP